MRKEKVNQIDHYRWIWRDDRDNVPLNGNGLLKVFLKLSHKYGLGGRDRCKVYKFTWFRFGDG